MLVPMLVPMLDACRQTQAKPRPNPGQNPQAWLVDGREYVEGRVQHGQAADSAGWLAPLQVYPRIPLAVPGDGNAVLFRGRADRCGSLALVAYHAGSA
jgi:hypothetical protein